MSLLEQQKFLAELFVDPALRKSFLGEPQVTGKRFDLDDAEIEEFLEVVQTELDYYADSLVWKRFREIEKLLPRLRGVLGRDFRSCFFEYAPSFNPDGVRKHYADGLEFCRWIEASTDPILSTAKASAEFERKRLQFVSGERSIAFCRLPGSTAGNERRIIRYGFASGGESFTTVSEIQKSAGLR